MTAQSFFKKMEISAKNNFLGVWYLPEQTVKCSQGNSEILFQSWVLFIEWSNKQKERGRERETAKKLV